MMRAERARVFVNDREITRSVRSLESRLERRRAEEAIAIARAQHARGTRDEDELPGDGALSWLGAVVVVGWVVVVAVLVWLKATGRV